MDTKIEMVRFTEEDWYGFAGCERFADGGAPFIGGLKVDGSDAVVIHDAEGIHVVWGGTMEEDGEDFFADYAAPEGDAPVGTVDRILAALQPEMTSVALKALGFEVPAGASGGHVLDGDVS